MPIEFYCPGCGRLMRTPDETAGRKGRCPNCRVKVQIPASTLAVPAPQPPAARSKWRLSHLAFVREKITFACSACQHSVRVNRASAGKKGQCPRCGSIVEIPTQSQAVPPKSAPTAMPSGLTPLLDDTGPTSLPFSAHAPLSASPALQPLGRPASLLGDDILSSLPAQSQSQAFHPYAAQTLPAAAVPSEPRPTRNRQGLPWEQPGDDRRFSGTLSLVLFSPTEAFRTMKLRSGFGQPMLFCLAAAGFSLAIPLVIAMVLFAIGLVLSVALGGGAPNRVVPNVHSISPGLAAAAVIGYTALYFLMNGVVHPLLRAGFHHLTLLIVQGAEERFEATYRATAYTSATLLAVMMPLVLVTTFITVIITPGTMLPLLPLLIILAVIGMVVMDIIWHTIALREAHGIGGGRAAGAVLLALVIHVVVSGVVSVGIQTLVGSLTPLRG